jgi:hypothetical protein
MSFYSEVQMLLMAFMGGIIGSITERVLTAILRKAQGE